MRHHAQLAVVVVLDLVGAVDLTGQSLVSFAGPPPAENLVIVRALASGSLRAVASGGSSDADNADGSIGINLVWPRRSLTAVINVATSNAQLTSGFAQSLLNPATGAGFKSGLLDYRISGALRLPKILVRIPRLGLHSYISVSSRIWQSPSDTTRHASATIWGVGVLAYKQVEVTSPDTANRVSLSVEFGVSLRELSGDIVGDHALRGELLNTDHRWFYGFEGGMSTSINKITAAVQMFWYIPRVQGIGRWQMTTGLSLQADVFSFRNRPESR